MNMLETLQNLLNDSGFVSFFADGGWKNLVMIAVSCLLLYLGIKNIRLGPTLPAFVSPNVLNYLVEHFGLAPITTPEEDLKQLLG